MGNLKLKVIIFYEDDICKYICLVSETQSGKIQKYDITYYIHYNTDFIKKIHKKRLL